MTTTIQKGRHVDPVCRMKVSHNGKVPVYTHGKDTYHFCTKACRDAFILNPDKYLSKKTGKGKGLWNRYLERLNKATGGKPPCCH